MGYDISLRDPETGQVVEAERPHDIRGGTYVVGGTCELWLKVTYNYSEHFYRIMGEKGVRSIYGMTGAESIPILEKAIVQLGTDQSDDYWEPTEGNARAALESLVELAKMAPSAVWHGD